MSSLAVLFDDLYCKLEIGFVALESIDIPSLQKFSSHPILFDQIERKCIENNNGEDIGSFIPVKPNCKIQTSSHCMHQILLVIDVLTHFLAD
jgi:hypothetical protein